MNILVTGANGQLGNEMRIVRQPFQDKYVFADVMDASKESIAMLKELASDDIRTNTDHLVSQILMPSVRWLSVSRLMLL